jgi:putative membrane protein
MIRRILWKTVICASVAITPPALAQAPGGGGGGQQSAPRMPDRPSGADANSPMNNPDTMTMKKVDDKKFLKDAAVGGLMEVELGKLATQKGSSDGVKKFGQKMVDDHSKANDQLKELATKENLQMPSELDSKHQSRLDKLSKLDGPAFDKAYIKDQLKDHEQDVSAFQSEAQNGQDPNIKQFAANTLPTLQEHLSMAKDLKKEGK